MTPPVHMEFGYDEFGKEILLKDGKFQVMMEWERPYMEACIDALQPAGDLLEVGFGCGYSASRIQTYHPKSHTIIEYHPLVAQRAREWAKAYPNVTIIEDTWQHALGSLGVFDQIFFDDYPLQTDPEMREMKAKKEQAHLVVETGKKRMQEIEQELPFLNGIRHTDEDILAFFSLLEKEEGVQGKVFLRFFFDLLDKESITQSQFETVLNELKAKKHVSDEEIAHFTNERKKQTHTKEWHTQARGDRLFEFLDLCLKSHMRVGSRFSCFLEDATSKFEDEKFFNLVITNPALSYRETRIPINVPPNCTYFQGNEALVITITKEG